MLGEPVEPAKRRLPAPLLGADVVLRRQRAALRVIQKASDRRAIELPPLVEAMVVHEHLGAHEVEEDQPELQLDCGRRDIDDLDPELTAGVQRSFEPVDHIGIELDEPEAG